VTASGSGSSKTAAPVIAGRAHVPAADVVGLRFLRSRHGTVCLTRTGIPGRFGPVPVAHATCASGWPRIGRFGQLRSRPRSCVMTMGVRAMKAAAVSAES
jgi:hypothetical protein